MKIKSIIIIVISCFSALSAQAKTIAVTPSLVASANDGQCSLMEAIEISQGILTNHADCNIIEDSSSIIFTLNLSGNYIFENKYSPFSGAALPVITKPLVLAGGNNGTGFTRNNGTASFFIDHQGSYLVIRNISFIDNASSSEGCIRNYNGDMIIDKSYFENCHTTASGGALFNNATLWLGNSKIIISSADNGGAIYNNTTGNMYLYKSNLAGNTATSFGGAINNSGLMTIDQSSLSRNSGKFGIIYNVGELDIINSTIATNTSEFSGIIANTIMLLGDQSLNGKTTLNNVTLTENEDLSGTGALYHSSNGKTVVNVYNSIIAGNSNNCTGPINDTVYSLIGKNQGNLISCFPLLNSGTTFINNNELKLTVNPVSDFTNYYYPLHGSPAIDGGAPQGCYTTDGSTLLIDQKGGVRPLASLSANTPRCDIGAIEINKCQQAGCFGDKNIDDDGDGATENEGDCNDNNNQQSPAFPEICDGIDNNCDGFKDNGAINTKTFYLDKDSDGYGSALNTKSSCTLPAGYSLNNLDCNDNDSLINTEAIEICGDSIDQNCDKKDLSCATLDQDGDGITPDAGDCDDANAKKAPDQTEQCDGLDNNCDGHIDNNLGTVICGVGACQQTISICVNGVSQVCTPLLPQEEICGDNVDQNCDGSDLSCPVDEPIIPATPPETPSDTPTTPDTATGPESEASNTDSTSTSGSEQSDDENSEMHSNSDEEDTTTANSSGASGGGCQLHKVQSNSGATALIFAYFLITALMKGFVWGSKNEARHL